MLNGNGGHWVGSWATSPCGPFVSAAAGFPPDFADFTMRQTVRSTIGGEQVRVRLSNTFGADALRVGAAHIALRREGAANVPGSDRQLLFGGQPSVVIPEGASVFSDPADLIVPPLCELSVSLHSPDSPGTKGTTYHQLALQKTYLSYPTGNYCGVESLDVAGLMDSWFTLTGVDVKSSNGGHAIVAIGDCLTDGAECSAQVHTRWLDLLAARLNAAGRHISVLNAGIIGNRLLEGGPHPFEAMFGPSALSRFDRDVLDQSGVKQVIITEGAGDLTYSEFAGVTTGLVSADEVIAALQQLVERARARGLGVIGGTLLPIEGGVAKFIPELCNPTKDANRLAVNEWIRTGGAFDAVIDFEAMVRDPLAPLRLRPEFDAGDHFHLNDDGHRHVAEALDLSLFDC